MNKKGSSLLHFFNTSIGRYRLVGFLEGFSLLVLLFIAVPIKYIKGDPTWVKNIGPVHGAFFLLFVIMSFQMASEQNWAFRKTTFKVILSSFLPFGTFYIDHVLLRHLQSNEKR